MSLRTYARHRGVSVEAVSKAITAGRLRESVVKVDGQPKIASIEIADTEWIANTRPRVDHPPVPPRPMPSTSRDASEFGGDADDPPDYNRSRAVREAHAARREAALADMAEIEVAEKREELVPVAEARAYITDKFTVVKTRILGVPSGVAQRLPNLAAEVVPVMDSLLREVLEELAIDHDGGDGEEDETE